MTDVEQLVVALRLALDEAKQDAAEAMTSGCPDWGFYQYERGRHDGLKLALAHINEAFANLAKDEA